MRTCANLDLGFWDWHILSKSSIISYASTTLFQYIIFLNVIFASLIFPFLNYHKGDSSTYIAVKINAAEVVIIPILAL